MDANSQTAEQRIESLEKQLLAMREALKSLAHADGCYCEASFAMGNGSHPRHSSECQAATNILDSTPSDIARKYVKREVLEKCVETIEAVKRVNCLHEYPWFDAKVEETLTLARKELEK